MLKNLMMNGTLVFTAVGVMALAGCGQSGGGNGNGNGNGGGSAAAPTDADTGHSDAGDTGHGAGDHAGHDHGGDSGSASSSVALDESSAAGALATYMNRLKAGDFMGAAEICLPEAPGTAELIKLGTNFENMANDPENASIGETAKAIFIDEFKTMESTKVLEEDGFVVYEVSVINKAAVSVRVENRDGVWRVIPPISGTPTG